MTRKVSLWIVIALVAALAVALAAMVVLANDDGRGVPAATGPADGAWHQVWGEGREAPVPPMMGSLGGWGRGDDTPLLPWALFAVATGTAVGLLVAWSPWRAQPAATAAVTTMGASVADEPAIEGMAQAEDDGGSDGTADAGAPDDTATRETPPQA